MSRADATRARRGAGMVRHPLAALLALLACVVSQPGGWHASAAQSSVSDADLERASVGRTLRLGSASTPHRVTTVSLESYVARVLAGEGEPAAPDVTQQALAIAIRTFALKNAGRHAREGFDVCDGTHCQVPRASTPATRRAALASAGRVLTYNGSAAEVFYSASCGGRSESAEDVWPGANLPYLRSVVDEVHDDDVPWTLELTLGEIRSALGRAGFAGGRLRRVEVEARSESGRVTRLRAEGLRPDVIGGEPFRAAIGARTLRSTAFTLEQRGDTVRFTGRGYGHGVGMCVVGAGRRGRLGQSVEQILQVYYPGLVLESLDGDATSRSGTRADTVAAVPSGSDGVRGPRRRPERDPETSASPSSVVVHVQDNALVSAADLEALTLAARRDIAAVLGAPTVPVIVALHSRAEDYRRATGRPWWVASSINGTTIDLSPSSPIEGRAGLANVVRSAMAELLMSDALRGRPEWVRVGGARYFAGSAEERTASRSTGTPAETKPCPSDAELTLAVSAATHRDAEARAEACFARAYERTQDWRAVR